MSKVTTDDVAVDQHSSGGPGIDVDGSRASTCNNICGKYWTLKATANDSSTLVAAQGTLDAMCPSVCTTAECICTADPKCDCETNNQGHWLATTKKCICKGLTGSAWDECLCTQGSGGIFINGHCDNKGSGNLPTYDSNGNPVNSGSTAGNDSTGTASDQASISSAGTPSTAGLAGLGGGNAGAIAGAGTGKSWYEQLQHEFGMAGSGAGQKFDAGRGGNYGTPGGGSSSTNKGTNLGIYLSNIDLFTMVSSTYTSQYTNGSIAAPTISNKNASKQKNRLGTKPVSF